MGGDTDVVQGEEGGVRGLAGERLYVSTEIVKIHLVRLLNKDKLNYKKKKVMFYLQRLASLIILKKSPITYICQCLLNKLNKVET